MVVLSIAVAGRSSYLDDRRHRTWLFVKQVLLETEYGDKGGVVARWAKPISVYAISDDPADYELVGSVVDEINSALPKPLLQFDRNANGAPIRIYIIDHRHFGVIAEAGGFEYVPGNLGFFVSYLDDAFELYDAVILVSRAIASPIRRALILEELTQALGPMNDSLLFRDSIFYEAPGDYGNVPHLTSLDVKLLRFLYDHLNPGDDDTALKRAFDLYWDSVAAD